MFYRLKVWWLKRQLRHYGNVYNAIAKQDHRSFDDLVAAAQRFGDVNQKLNVLRMEKSNAN